MEKEFGNWVVNDDGLIYQAGVYSDSPYRITRTRLWEDTYRDGVKLFDWHIHIAEKSTMSTEDIYNLNKAWDFAEKHFRELRPQDLSDIDIADILSSTLKYQKEILDWKNR